VSFKGFTLEGFGGGERERSHLEQRDCYCGLAAVLQAFVCMTGIRLAAWDVLRHMLEAVKRLGMEEPLCNSDGEDFNLSGVLAAAKVRGGTGAQQCWVPNPASAECVFLHILHTEQSLSCRRWSWRAGW
jgi:hypothetical protein